MAAAELSRTDFQYWKEAKVTQSGFFFKQYPTSPALHIPSTFLINGAIVFFQEFVGPEDIQF